MLVVANDVEPRDEFVAKGRWLQDGGVIEQTDHPRADGGERGHAEHEVDRPVVGAGDHLVLADLVDDPARLERVDADTHFHGVVAFGLPGLVGQSRLHVHLHAVGDGAAARLAARHVAVDPVDAERAHALALDVPGHEVPVPEAEPQAHGRDDAGRTAVVGEGGPGTCADRLEQLDQRGRRDERRDRPDVAEPCRAQLQQRVPATRIAEVDAGDGEVERDLLVGFEIEVGQVERLAFDPVPVLLGARQPLGEDGDALVTQEPLVPLEGLAARRVLGGVPRDIVRDGVEGQRLLRLEQDEDEVGDALEPIELRGGLHRPEPTAAGAP